MVPKGWQFSKLGSVAELQRGFDLPSTKRIDGDVPIVSSSGVSGYHNEHKVEKPGIVTGRYGSIGNVYYVEEDFWPLNTSLWVKDFHGNYPKFIYYLLSSFDFKKFSDKTGVPGVNRNDLHAVKVLVPPILEQQRIVKILSTWDKATSTTERLIDNSTQQKKALMQQLLTGKKRLLNDEGKPFEGEWEEVELKDIANIYQPQTISQKHLTNEGYLVYGANGIIGKYSDYNHENEQIAVTCRGSTCGVVNWTEPKSWITGNAMVINVDEFEQVSKRYLYYKLSFTNFSYLISGSGQPQITGNIKNHKAEIPSLKEQQKIATVLTNADKEIELLEQQLADLQQEKKALMQVLLTGKKRVVVD